MSKAVPGDGQLRRQIVVAGEVLSEAARTYHDLVFSDEGKIRNNMDTPSSEGQIEVLRDVLAKAAACREVMEAAYEHHKKQTSVLPNNIFGQRLRIKSDGNVSIIDELDADKFAARLRKDGALSLKPEQLAIYMARGSNPHPNFRKWGPDVQRKYLLGELDPDQAGNIIV